MGKTEFEVPFSANLSHELTAKGDEARLNSKAFKISLNLKTLALKIFMDFTIALSRRDMINLVLQGSPEFKIKLIEKIYPFLDEYRKQIENKKHLEEE